MANQTNNTSTGGFQLPSDDDDQGDDDYKDDDYNSHNSASKTPIKDHIKKSPVSPTIAVD